MDPKLGAPPKAVTTPSADTVQPPPLVSLAAATTAWEVAAARVAAPGFAVAAVGVAAVGVAAATAPLARPSDRTAAVSARPGKRLHVFARIRDGFFSR